MAGSVHESLKERFAWPQHVWLTEVRNAPGWPANLRTADGIAMSVWKSRGLFIEGVEVKASRSDWIRELRKPDKADEIYQYCDYWWLAVAGENIVQPGELPRTWGLLVLVDGKLREAKRAPKLKPKPISRELFAMMLRRCYERPDPAEELIRQRVAALEEEQRQAWIQHGERTSDGYKRSYEALSQSVQAFEQKSGIQIHAYDGARLGEAMQQVLSGRHNWIRERLEGMKESGEALVRLASEALAKDDELAGTTVTKDVA